MSEKVALTVSCDVCGRPFWMGDDNDRRGRPKRVNTAVWFETEQNEGKPVEPYIQTVEIDLCPECAAKAIRIWAHGCMGFNDYMLRDGWMADAKKYKAENAKLRELVRDLRLQLSCAYDSKELVEYDERMEELEIEVD